MEVPTAERTIANGSSDLDRHLAPLFEAAALGIAICQSDGRIVEGNAALARLLGHEQLELAGLDPWRLYEDDSLPASRCLADIARGTREFFSIEKTCRRKDLSEFWGRLTFSRTQDHSDGSPFVLVLLEDATERNQLLRQLRQAEKMELIGRLTAGIVHDFNNLLTGFLLYCDLLLSKLDSSDPLRYQVEQVREAGEQGSSLTQQLLGFARKQAPKARPVSLSQVVLSTEHLLRRLIGEHINLQFVVDTEAGAVVADPTQLREILLNLVLNARDALKPGGRIDIRTRAAPLPEKFKTKFTGSCVSLIVEDDGCGLTAEARAHLFEPFFTTKVAGKGVGIGLATVYRIVTGMGGHIEVASEPNRGTRFEIFFPASESEPESLAMKAECSEGKLQSRIDEIPALPTAFRPGGPIVSDPPKLQHPAGQIIRPSDVQLASAPQTDSKGDFTC